ncbi:uncharacterized protein SPPG_07279 [Spizellomyces punctatus DAOM BR117]|uniref:F-box domain-containing protein n=1 Tax=Spizellomyces punctatus (strain DAOM BR117) TaxID=645134 RepID=A0A0L0H8N9_SPIPD|nr:uncharacterized protein SPPG_07279 [Spizellomyces punctatus DAOM BR117]KNC97351.1 hypothetical protein SPPG_07279 [Spizellomyces punctatus DAOM BR117]|eukprot:XP_016605391.1 hypothetical protein SPPG_07279 [Spizellomyces punctatus DAOM BR117]
MSTTELPIVARLPEDLLILIFRFAKAAEKFPVFSLLPVLQQVNRHWYCTVRNAGVQLWRRVEWSTRSPHWRFTENKLLQLIEIYGQHVEVLNLDVRASVPPLEDDWEVEDDDVNNGDTELRPCLEMATPGTSFQHIRQANAPSWSFNEQKWACIFRCLPNLRDLVILRRSLNYPIDAHFLDVLGSHCHHLERLTLFNPWQPYLNAQESKLSRNWEPSIKDINKLLQNTGNLRVLRLGAQRFCGDILRGILRSLALYAPDIQEFDVDECVEGDSGPYDVACVDVTPTDWELFCTNCKDLRYWNFALLKSITAEDMMIWTQHPKRELRTLRLERRGVCGNWGFGPVHLATAIAACPKLEQLIINTEDGWLDDDGMSLVCSSCPYLKHLFLCMDEDMAMTDVSLAHIGRLSHLQTLEIVSNPTITAHGLLEVITARRLASHSQHAQGHLEISIAYCAQVHPMTFLELLLQVARSAELPFGIRRVVVDITNQGSTDEEMDYEMEGVVQELSKFFEKVECSYDGLYFRFAYKVKEPSSVGAQ